MPEAVEMIVQVLQGTLRTFQHLLHHVRSSAITNFVNACTASHF